MNFTFTKYLINGHYRAGYGRLEKCSMYTVYNGEEKIGAFFYSDEVSWFAFDEEDLRIDYIKKLFRKTRYQIVDQKTNSVIGGYDNVRHIYSFNSHGKLYLSEEIFLSYKLDTRVKTGFFSKSDESHFKIKVGNLKQQVTYSFYMQPTSMWHTLYKGNHPFQGTIEYQGNDHFLLMSGFFLVQKILEAEDNESNG